MRLASAKYFFYSKLTNYKACYRYCEFVNLFQERACQVSEASLRRWEAALSNTHLLKSLLKIGFGALLIPMACSAQSAAQGTTAEVFLIRQDSSDCTNSDVSANDPSRIGGTVWVVRNENGKTSVKVAITATPNTVYHFFLKCATVLGEVKTEDEGEGNANFEFPTNSVGAVYAFDMYPDGAPAGNKFQSIQVKFP
jgi:hypothetical protein